MCATPDLVEVLVHVLSDRIRTFTSFHFQTEKLMALGKLSAGLAHELNNPASAIVRSTSALRDDVIALLQQATQLAHAPLSDHGMTTIRRFIDRAVTEGRPALNVLERAEREDEITDWLEEQGMEDASDYASLLVDGGGKLTDLVELHEVVPREECEFALTWLWRALDAVRNVAEIEEAGRRISSLVKSVKTYTRLDQVHDKQQVNVNDGIRNTLVILQHKVRHNNVTVEERLAEDLPEIRGFPGELNQVWTNVMDNALDAMEQSGGVLTVSTRCERDRVEISIGDTGAGIPEELQNRIFDPFYTTKKIGQGSGVGLDVVQQIVSQHAGTINVESRPGRTVFTIQLPIGDKL